MTYVWFRVLKFTWESIRYSNILRLKKHLLNSMQVLGSIQTLKNIPNGVNSSKPNSQNHPSTNSLFPPLQVHYTQPCGDHDHAEMRPDVLSSHRPNIGISAEGEGGAGQIVPGSGLQSTLLGSGSRDSVKNTSFPLASWGGKPVPKKFAQGG